jgi:hypothetical protein
MEMALSYNEEVFRVIVTKVKHNFLHIITRQEPIKEDNGIYIKPRQGKYRWHRNFISDEHVIMNRARS